MTSIESRKLLGPTLRRLSFSERIGFYSNFHARNFAAGLVRRYLEMRARISGRSFRCRALSGESNYNISINADLSVSCNCDDIYGQGRLGSMKLMTFREIFSGPTAKKFRRQLADGRIPITKCVTCPELEKVPKRDGEYWVTHYELPVDGVMFENNAGCNLSCTGCGRAFRPLEELKIGVTNLEKVAREIAVMGIKRISFFSLGEPFMSKNIFEEMRIIRKYNPNILILTSTNGVLLDSDEKRRAALLMDEVTFSVDGCSQESLVRYQVGSDFSKAYDNMCRLVDLRNRTDGASTVIMWKYVVFNWNDSAHYLERTRELAEKAGVDVLHFTFTLNPFFGISWRFLFAAHWKELSPMKFKRREIDYTGKNRPWAIKVLDT